LFGPTPPSTWGPPPDRPWHIALWAGRRGDPHGDTTDDGLLEITVAQVLEAVGRARASASTRFAAVAT
jgi:ADP-heptose:LPS heptosyltransferase